MTSAAPPGGDRGRAHGLLLFDAEESLARGEAEKALVLASRAVKERPDSLTARALLERARRELLRGKRRERLEARIAEAERLFGSGEFAAAEKIVSSALKLIPDHPAALALFGKLRERPRGLGIEAEADSELARIAASQAQKALDAARVALASRWDRKALFQIRRGLRQVPDHPELLALLREAQGTLERLDAERARRRAFHAQVRAGLELLAAGNNDESLRILRAVLLEDPDNARAQAAIQEVRRRVLGQQPPGERAPRSPAGPAAPPAAAPGAPLASPPQAARTASERPLLRAPRPAAPPPDLVADRSLPFVPVEILLPRTRRHRTPLRWVVTGAALVLGAIGLISVSGRSAPPPAAPLLPPPPAITASSPRPAPPNSPRGPLEFAEPALRTAIEATLGAYARALQSADAQALAAARPDLEAEARRARLAPFVGALNAATDIRVLDLIVTGDHAEVPILCTDVIIGGRSGAQAPVAETLRFDRRRGQWSLRAR